MPERMMPRELRRILAAARAVPRDFMTLTRFARIIQQRSDWSETTVIKYLTGSLSEEERAAIFLPSPAHYPDWCALRDRAELPIIPLPEVRRRIYGGTEKEKNRKFALDTPLERRLGHRLSANELVEAGYDLKARENYRRNR